MFLSFSVLQKMHNLPLTSFYVALLQFVTYDWNILTWIMPVHVT